MNLWVNCFLFVLKPHFISSAYPFSATFAESIENSKSKSRLSNLLYLLTGLGPRVSLLYAHSLVFSKICLLSTEVLTASIFSKRTTVMSVLCTGIWKSRRVRMGKTKNRK